MRKYSGYNVILFALLLAFASIGRHHYEALPTTSWQAAAVDHAAATVSEEQFPEALCSQRSGELVVSSLISLPAPVSKIHPNNFLGGTFSIEYRKRSQARELLSQARNICPNLSVGVIIFPFHHFL